ncbi:hypothetical protein THAOC_06040, partial [Thalassiosira oceanica]
MFVFGSAAAQADAEGDDGSGRGKASSSTADGAPSFAFDASFLPAVTATATDTSDDAPAAAGGFKFNVLPPQPAAAATEGEDTAPLFGSTFKSSQEVGVGVKTQTKHEVATDGGSGEQGVPIVMHAPVASTAGHLPRFVTEDQLMSSGHELPDIYTCPLCCLPIALPVAKNSSFEKCCMKRVCNGCRYASYQLGLGDTCAFCRTPTPRSDDAMLALVGKRVDAKDPNATEFLAYSYYDGDYGLQPDIPRANELWTEAANLGHLSAHFQLGRRYYFGQGLQEDEARGVRHWQHGAICGHPESRYILGVREYENGNYELAVQHLMISAKMGDEDSLNEIKDMSMKGHVTKAQYAEALRGYQNALEEAKSPSVKRPRPSSASTIENQNAVEETKSSSTLDGADEEIAWNLVKPLRFPPSGDLPGLRAFLPVRCRCSIFSFVAAQRPRSLLAVGPSQTWDAPRVGQAGHPARGSTRRSPSILLSLPTTATWWSTSAVLPLPRRVDVASGSSASTLRGFGGSPVRSPTAISPSSRAPQEPNPSSRGETLLVLIGIDSKRRLSASLCVLLPREPSARGPFHNRAPSALSFRQYPFTRRSLLGDGESNGDRQTHGPPTPPSMSSYRAGGGASDGTVRSTVTSGSRRTSLPPPSAAFPEKRHARVLRADRPRVPGVLEGAGAGERLCPPPTPPVDHFPAPTAVLDPREVAGRGVPGRRHAGQPRSADGGSGLLWVAPDPAPCGAVHAAPPPKAGPASCEHARVAARAAAANSPGVLLFRSRAQGAGVGVGRRGRSSETLLSQATRGAT